MMSNSDKKDAVWKEAEPLRGKVLDKYRQDPYGNEMRYGSYGTKLGKRWGTTI